MGWLSKLFSLDELSEATEGSTTQAGGDSRSDACNRLKLVLMHDRTQLSPDIMEKMRDELVSVISRYVDIDQDALQLNLESESNTVALVANIPLRSNRVGEPAGTKETPPQIARSGT